MSSLILTRRNFLAGLGAAATLPYVPALTVVEQGLPPPPPDMVMARSPIRSIFEAVSAGPPIWFGGDMARDQDFGPPRLLIDGSPIDFANLALTEHTESCYATMMRDGPVERRLPSRGFEVTVEGLMDPHLHDLFLNRHPFLIGLQHMNGLTCETEMFMTSWRLEVG